MVKMGRLTDYGIVVMTYLAAAADRVHSANDVAAGTRLRRPTVGKLLGILTRRGFLRSHRGARGGYSLARAPEEISVASIIRVFEGPLSFTVCSGNGDPCEHETACPVRGHWQGINLAVIQALESISLAELTGPVAPAGLHERIASGLREAVGQFEAR